MLEAMGGDPPQDRWAAHAMRGAAGVKLRYLLQQPAAWAFAQLRPARGRCAGHCGRGGGSKHHPDTGNVVSIGATPSASRPTAALIAATSPGTPGAAGRTEKRKLRNSGWFWPVARTATWA